jgi:HSP20 family protein
MAIIPWKPSFDLDRFFEEDNRWLPLMPLRKFMAPAMDIYEEKDNIIVEMPLAGVPPEKVDISIENDILTVKGEVEEKKETKEADYYHKEIKRGSFMRQASLPVSVKGDDAVAETANGMLKIVIPKAEKPKSKKISVKLANK